MLFIHLILKLKAFESATMNIIQKECTTVSYLNI
jgi:hypothetical protein